MSDRNTGQLNELPINEIVPTDRLLVWQTATGLTRYILAEFFLGSEAIYDVTNYGATGDGVTDDTAAIQDCLDDAGAAAAILFPGTPTGYRALDLTVDSPNVIFMGSGYGSGLVKPTDGTILTVNGSNFTTQNMAFRGASASFTGSNVVVNGTFAQFLDSDSGDTAGRAIQGNAAGLFIRGGIYTDIAVEAPTASGIAGVTMSAVRRMNALTLNGVISPKVIGCRVNGIFTLGPVGLFLPKEGSFTGNEFLDDMFIGGTRHTFSGNIALCDTVNFASNTENCKWVGNTEGELTTVISAGASNNYILRQIGIGGSSDAWRQRVGADNQAQNQQFDTIYGFGTPEGVVTAAPPSIYFNMSGGALTSMYVKESGTGPTGWVGK